MIVKFLDKFGKLVKSITSIGYLPVDVEPVEGSHHFVTSDALAKIAPANVSTENPVMTALATERMILATQHIADMTLRLEFAEKDYVPTSNNENVVLTKVKSINCNVWDLTCEDANWAYLLANFEHEFRVLACGDLSDVTSTYCSFNDSNVTSVEGLSIPNSTNTEQMFKGCSKLERVQIVDMGSVTNADQMFVSCVELKDVELGNTSALLRCEYMFQGRWSLVEAPSFDTSSLWDTQGMFYECKSLKVVPEYDLSSMQYGAYMFSACYALEQVPNFNTVKNNHFEYMFQGCESLKHAPTLDYTAAEKCYEMYHGCYNIEDGMVAAYQGLSAVISSQSKYYYCFKDAGINTESGMAERAQIPAAGWSGDYVPEEE